MNYMILIRDRSNRFGQEDFLPGTLNSSPSVPRNCFLIYAQLVHMEQEKSEPEQTMVSNRFIACLVVSGVLRGGFEDVPNLVKNILVPARLLC